jgi:hypothetical protein
MRKEPAHIVISLRLFAAACLLTSLTGCGCPDEEVYVRIGDFDSRDAALRAAIPKLATEIRKCPRVKTYRIVFTSPGIYAVDRHALLYSRRNGPQARIGYEDDVFSGISPDFGPYTVDDTVVAAVAEKGGSLEDFAQFDRTRK